ncbi:hypothetical protein J2T13_004351 [Paenibacillus sp. DS2015]|uniref:hypothetical protein n=1 Tax=Paenibacillus sp. DS2015 TaxID=3373917 RepID=UPI003D1C9E5A
MLAPCPNDREADPREIPGLSASSIFVGIRNFGYKMIVIKAKYGRSRDKLDVLVETLGLKLITTAEEDMNAMLALS